MIVTLDEMKNYLRVDHEDDDALIESLIASSEQLCMDVARITDEDAFEKESCSRIMKLVHANKDYSRLADEIDMLRDKKQELLVSKSQTEGLKNRIKELYTFLDSAELKLTEYDELLVRKYR